MKKQKLQNLLQLGILIFGISLLLTNCEKENDTLQPIQETNSNPYSVTKVKFNEISNNSNLLSKINAIKKGVEQNNISASKTSQKKTVYISEYDFYIDTDEAKYLEESDGTYHSYTFPIYKINNETSNLFQNLFFSFNDSNGDYDTFVINYNLTPSERENINNLSSSELEDKTSMTYLENFDTDVILNSLVYVDVETSTCWSGSYDESPSTGWEGSYVTWTQFDCAGGGSGSGGTSSNNDDTSNTEVPATNEGSTTTSNPNNSSGGRGGTINNDAPISAPYVMPLDQQRKKTFTSIQLTDEEFTLFSSLSLETQNTIFEFLENQMNSGDLDLLLTQYPHEAVEFVKNANRDLTLNKKVDLEESFASPFNVDLELVRPTVLNPEPEKVKFMCIYNKLIKS
ncbi:hypothetical protein [uncultured Algibacter sp.]|uniref:hypothetical protein n=1 Tax=uncultured Algibacter sp. TaxID=298659 RepID=UPI00260A10D3|nr:hypothetical protein [uncultured Algibacter sp.]